ncbi:SRPBCC domain-containing protein [Endozoicomonas arenosclerae]|uniref:SRPBCC domain-containing protein n=1 Tax=Endozoicomonas arenosclerae TaxID=1633495 RepID=UPI00078278CC|nr:SRPBCC domain-containing protein [Endozoicomonas arenosclerae]
MITEDTVTSDEVVINAPAEVVWDILVNFKDYHKWNRFCPKADATLELGSPIKMMVELGFGLQEQVEYISLIEPCKAIAWGMENKPGDPIHAVRTQFLKPLDDNRCTYFSIDDFKGSEPEALRGMMELMAKRVEDGFNLCARGLKEYAEKIAVPA